MISDSYEYAVLLGLFLLVNYAVFPGEIHAILRKRGFWYSQALFLLFGFLIDLIAINLGWWYFSSSKLIGVDFLGVPVEEFILFLLFHLAMCVSWESFRHDLE